MPYEITNRLRGPSTIRITGVTDTGALALGAFSANQVQENVNSLYVTAVKWSVLPATGTLIITRGGTVVATLYGEGDWKHDELAIANTATNAGTFQVAITGGGTALIAVKKEATYNVETYKL